jgi:hypothetical protein
MKQLAFFVVLILVLGVCGFLYRNTLEAPNRNTAASTTAQNACALDAKICPDGTSVGRTGPNCSFEACPAPNVELPQVGISFVLPAGFVANAAAVTPSDSLIAAYEKSMMSEPKDAIVVRRYAIPEGKDANDVMLANTMYESSGMQPKSMTEFKPVIVNGKTFQSLVVERFEAQVHTVYYLPREHDVLRFEAIQHNVTNWTDAGLDVTTLPTQKAVLSLLGTLQLQTN